MGNSVTSMSDKYKEEKIELPPPSPTLQQDSISQWMEWRTTVQRQPTEEELKELARSLVKTEIAVSFSLLDSNKMRIIVRQSPIGDYTLLYEASIRALFRLEQLTGTLLSI